MKLNGLRVKNFRGIEDITLDNIENFNVLVGKNNAGKSTIVFAIDYFFNTIKPEIVSSVFDKTDYYNEDQTKPINFIGSLCLNNTFLSLLLSKMQEEHLQLAAAIDTLKNSKYLNIYTSSLNERINVGYIKKISLSNSPVFENSATENVLFNISSYFAEELYDRREKIDEVTKRNNEIEEKMNTLRKEEYARVKDYLKSPKEQPQRRIPGVRPLNSEVIELIQDTNTFDEFKTIIHNLFEENKSKLNDITKVESKNDYTVFAGKTKEIPKHII